MVFVNINNHLKSETKILLKPHKLYNHNTLNSKQFSINMIAGFRLTFIADDDTITANAHDTGVVY